ncbi:hypothetical protein IW262DRAFT_1493160 [Armillaria fumosa]|nr:hypothetical protein IW262DRAFT_1493160 [Armillaria fumosa]
MGSPPLSHPISLVPEYIRHPHPARFFISDKDDAVMIYEISTTPDLSAISNIKALFSTVTVTDFVIALMMYYYLHNIRAAMSSSKLNHGSKHQSKKSNTGNDDHSTSESAILQFTPHSTTETDISVPPSESQETGSFIDELDNSKGHPCFEV